MAKKVMQVRYYGDANANNYPAKLTLNKIKNGSVFADYLPMCYLKITGPSGLKFYLNNSIYNVALNDGVFELDLDGIAEIINLTFDSRSFTNNGETIVNENTPLIIDIIANY